MPPKHAQATVRENFPNVSTVREANLPELREALQMLGAETHGPKAELVERLKAELGLKPHQRDQHKDKKQRVTGKGNDKKDDKESKKKPPPPSLPSESPKETWEQFIHSPTGKKYWHNSKTGETKWDVVKKPPPPADKPGPPASSVSDAPSTNQHSQIVPVSSGITAAGANTNGVSSVPCDPFSSMLRALAQGGANITLNAPGAFAAGCVVNMGQDPPRNKGTGRSPDDLLHHRSRTSYDRGPPPRWHAQY